LTSATSPSICFANHNVVLSSTGCSEKLAPDCFSGSFGNDNDDGNDFCFGSSDPATSDTNDLDSLTYTDNGTHDKGGTVSILGSYDTTDSNTVNMESFPSSNNSGSPIDLLDSNTIDLDIVYKDHISLLFEPMTLDIILASNEVPTSLGNRNNENSALPPTKPLYPAACELLPSSPTARESIPPFSDSKVGNKQVSSSSCNKC
jgi:hypothetical protein